jgi:hypothetical protein
MSLQPFYEQYIYRKLKLSSFINRQKIESRMLNNFISKYGKPDKTIIGFGDFEQYKHLKFMELVKGKGFPSLFSRACYQMYLVDEFRTSCRCSKCESDEFISETFRKCKNPRPLKENTILRHGLVKCTTCSGLWNRNMNASRNIYNIVTNDVDRMGRPVYLRRSLRLLSHTTSVFTRKI